MLRHSFGLNDEAAAIEAAVAKAINAGNRTGDIYNPLETTAKKVGTTQMGDAIAAAV
jgi:3-isopropylmalate dehydrogenase